MSIEYDRYLAKHREYVQHGAKWIVDNISKKKLFEIVPNLDILEFSRNIKLHDSSKYTPIEYYAYDDYFYGEKVTPEVAEAFDYAWLHHIHNNPHHWQYWILKEDDSLGMGDCIFVKCLDIPDNYLVEMIADWWSFSWDKYNNSGKKRDLYEIFNWYDQHVDKIAMSPNSEQKVKNLLTLFQATLDLSEEY